MFINLITKVRRTMHEPSEIFNKNIRKYQREITKLKNAETELKNSIEVNTRPHQVKQRISELKDRAVGFIQTGVKRKKNKKESI